MDVHSLRMTQNKWSKHVGVLVLQIKNFILQYSAFVGIFLRIRNFSLFTMRHFNTLLFNFLLVVKQPYSGLNCLYS
jgi:hypothetical protein